MRGRLEYIVTVSDKVITTHCDFMSTLQQAATSRCALAMWSQGLFAFLRDNALAQQDSQARLNRADSVC